MKIVRNKELQGANTNKKREATKTYVNLITKLYQEENPSRLTEQLIDRKPNATRHDHNFHRNVFSNVSFLQRVDNHKTFKVIQSRLCVLYVCLHVDFLALVNESFPMDKVKLRFIHFSLLCVRYLLATKQDCHNLRTQFEGRLKGARRVP